MTDKWKHLRVNLYGNVEPSVNLVGLTVPGALCDGSFIHTCGQYTETWEVERQVANAARVSTGADIHDNEKMIRNLIKLGHHTPLEAVQYNFYVTGISKACSAQISRHRTGTGHVSASRRYQTQRTEFVYPLLNSIENETEAKNIYSEIEKSLISAVKVYGTLRELGVKKGDARFVVPVASATSRMWWINARALRHLLSLRLDKTAEEEVRRLAIMLLNIAKTITPTLFEDFTIE